MAKILDALKGINAYPVPLRAFNEIAEGRGLDLDGDTSLNVLKSKDYRLAKADVLMWLADAPNISQGGQSYTFSEEQRANFRRCADTLYAECEEEESLSKPKFGYKGKNL